MLSLPTIQRSFSFYKGLFDLRLFSWHRGVSHRNIDKTLFKRKGDNLMELTEWCSQLILQDEKEKVLLQKQVMQLE